MFPRRPATVIISAPDASCARTITAGDVYLPVPTISREENALPAITRLSMSFNPCRSAALPLCRSAALPLWRAGALALWALGAGRWVLASGSRPVSSAVDGLDSQAAARTLEPDKHHPHACPPPTKLTIST